MVDLRGIENGIQGFTKGKKTLVYPSRQLSSYSTSSTTSSNTHEKGTTPTIQAFMTIAANSTTTTNVARNLLLALSVAQWVNCSLWKKVCSSR